ncbi:cytochrome P450 4C1-like [Polistes fuscatus]|uniref:cytochrome P450 4C1-like n=1 Tax=Polistes fuscatus TaxID=30207 RepID=UPI001CA7E15C|nr:cytochrome P450 4C1-like [Polistes fuscatus]
MKYLERVIKETLRLFPPAPILGRVLQKNGRECGNYDPKCFLPFSAGRRDCIGQTLAMIDMKGIVATILRKCVVQIDNPVIVKDIDLKYNVT